MIKFGGNFGKNDGKIGEKNYFFNKKITKI